MAQGEIVATLALMMVPIVSLLSVIVGYLIGTAGDKTPTVYAYIVKPKELETTIDEPLPHEGDEEEEEEEEEDDTPPTQEEGGVIFSQIKED
jgi:hypothetical protein